MYKSWFGVLLLSAALAINCQGSGGGGDSDDGPAPTNAILVSSTSPLADDANSCLTASAPCLTIAGGLAKAQAAGKAEVHAAGGIYLEPVTLASGINLRGGYNPATWKRTAGVTATLIRPQAAGDGRAVIAQGLTAATAFEGFVVMGPNLTNPGASSYGIWVRDCGDNLTLSSNVVFAGSGAPGAAGTGGADGADGGYGQDGQDAVDIIDAYGVAIHGCVDALHYRAGGGGGDQCEGAPTDGGQGGRADCPLFTDTIQTDPPHASEFGAAGLGTAGGLGGGAGRDVYHQVFNCLGYTTYGVPQGGNGSDGAFGADGAAAAPPAAGSVDPSGSWAGPVSASGADGLAGGGGGGGGSGAGAYMHDSCNSKGYGGDNLGGTGGGGGGGGCGGGGGDAGQAGGGSFAIFVSFVAPPASLPAIHDNTLYTGAAGNGGNGGAGGLGGFGGPAGAGGAGRPLLGDVDSAYPAFPGGDGGLGGSGGHGSAGGGGAGGPSYGIFAADYGPSDPSPWKTNNTVVAEGSAGTGGSGGYSAGIPGPDGPAGAQGDFNF